MENNKNLKLYLSENYSEKVKKWYNTWFKNYPGDIFKNGNHIFKIKEILMSQIIVFLTKYYYHMIIS